MELLPWFFGVILLLASLGVVTARKPVYASLSFVLVVIALTAIFFQLHAEVIGAMQLLVYGGATLVVFMFIIVLFQDAHKQIDNLRGQSSTFLLGLASALFILMTVLFEIALSKLLPEEQELAAGFGYAKPLGEELYSSYFLPFEIVSLIFLIALVGALYTAKKGSESCPS